MHRGASCVLTELRPRVVVARLKIERGIDHRSGHKMDGCLKHNRCARRHESKLNNKKKGRRAHDRTYFLATPVAQLAARGLVQNDTSYP